MLVPTPKPDERTLRQFMLGTLAREYAEQVETWLASDPSAADSFHELAPHDLLTEVVADTAAVATVPDPPVDRIIRSVLHSLGATDTLLPASTPTALADTGEFRPTGSPKSEQSPTPWPTRLGGYRVVREIGRGGMGVVLEVEDEVLKRRVAVKVMSLELCETRRQRPGSCGKPGPRQRSTMRTWSPSTTSATTAGCRSS